MRVLKLLVVSVALASSLALALELPKRPTTNPDVKRDVSLSWTPPTEREDGTALIPSDLTGYEVAAECGKKDKRLLIVNGGGTSKLDIPELTVGTCSFAIAAKDADGLYSQWSNVISVDIESGTGPKKIQLFEN